MPNGRQLASGSSFASRSLKTFSAQGNMERVSPGFRPFEMSPELLPPPIQAPDKSGVPSARCGAGPDTRGGWRKMDPSVELGGGAVACAKSAAATAASVRAPLRIRLNTLERPPAGILSHANVACNVLTSRSSLRNYPAERNERWRGCESGECWRSEERR